jgi:hypothetical protein
MTASPTELTFYLALLVTFMASVGVPLWVLRRNTAQAKAEREAKAATDAAAGETISWEAINRALIDQRDRLDIALKEAAVEHRQALQDMRDSFVEEAARLKQRTDADQDRAHAKIEQLAAEINSLYRRLAMSDRD